MSDLIGVPDLFARVGPILKNTLTRGTRPDPRITGMRPAARAAVTTWVLILIPALAALSGYLLLHLPAIDRALWHATATQAHTTATALTAGHYAAAAVAAISVTLAAITGGGSLYLIAAAARRAAAAAPRWTAGHPARRLLAIAAVAACVTALALYWTAQNQFHGW